MTVGLNYPGRMIPFRSLQGFIIFCVSGTLLAGSASRMSGALLAYDGFETYTASEGFGTELVGQTGGGTGWGGAWASGGGTPGTVKVINYNVMSYNNGIVSVSGGSNSLRVPQNPTSPGDFTINRALSASQTGEVWFSLLFKPGNEGSYGDFTQMFISDDGDVNNSGAVIADGRTGSQWAARVTGNSSNTTTNTTADLTDGTTYFIVGRFSKDGPDSVTNFDRMQLWLNPSSLTLGASTAIANQNSSTALVNTLGFRFFDYDANDSVLIDEIRIGESAADVIPVIPEPGTVYALLVGLAGVPLIVRRRR